uniref:C2H2-type domain-containing protein n=1 Tax=Plectus sambesii TaxID=2011161 RepID=A0A914UTY1_9BILA
MSSSTTATFIPSSEGSLEGKCSICDIVYKTRQSFNHHRRTKHPTETAEIKKGLLCPGQKCDTECANYNALIEHLKSAHGIDCAVETRNFDGLPQYNDWIASLELETNCSFINRGGGVQQGKDSTRLYKQCSRSGRYRSTAESSKNTRKKGTRKIQAHCPAYIRLNVDKNSGIVSAKMCLTHVGHEIGVKYIDLPKLLKNDIARLLNEGLDNKTIVSKLHAANNDPTKDRGYYLTEKHVDYYRKKLGFASGRPDLDDHVAVDLIVKQYENDDNSPILFYNPIVASDDKFALGLQTTGQRRLLDELGSNVISIDTTHKTTRYKYLLCTLMVLDEAGGGQPAAEFFIESESESDLIPLFEALKVRHPSLNPAYFMSDCASAFWNAWQKVFGGPEMRTKRIMCDWHIWRAWNGQMQNGANKIGTVKQRCVIRKCLAALMYEDDKAEFRRKYESIVNDLWIAGEESVKKFREYFLRYYPASTAHDWARFGRLHTDIATNMHLEPYH